MEKQLDISEIERLEFRADAIYKIKISTVKGTSLTIKASVGGEYAEQVVLDIKQRKNTLTIVPGYTPFFEKENDKLAAHKLQAIELEVLVPENIYVAIESKIASVFGFGNFKYFQAYLEDGDCILTDYNGNGFIQTKTGNVIVAVNPEVGIKAHTKTGKITGNPSTVHFYKLEIKTLSGAITILETN